MFGFLKELVEAIREGLKEGKAELSQEQARQAQAWDDACAEARGLAAAPTPETWLVAVAAPYRAVFARWPFRPGSDDGYLPADLYRMALPQARRDEWLALLRRDFHVVADDSAGVVMDLLLQQFDAARIAGSRENMALLGVRLAHMGSASVGVGLLPAEQVVTSVTPMLHALAGTFGGWRELGEAFLAGERSAAGSNLLGRRVLAGQVKELLKVEHSPWVGLPWPSAAQLTAPDGSMERGA